MVKYGEWGYCEQLVNNTKIGEACEYNTYTCVNQCGNMILFKVNVEEEIADDRRNQRIIGM